MQHAQNVLQRSTNVHARVTNLFYFPATRTGAQRAPARRRQFQQLNDTQRGDAARADVSTSKEKWSPGGWAGSAHCAQLTLNRLRGEVLMQINLRFLAVAAALSLASVSAAHADAVAPPQPVAGPFVLPSAGNGG